LVIKLPEGIEKIDAGDRMIVPGFIDLQVNGGGGVLLNENPGLSGLRQICAAHAKFGKPGLLPTLITDTYEITAKTVAAGKQAKAQGLPGFLGLHLEGPHLSIARRVAHDPQLIRQMEEKDIELMLSCKGKFDAMMITIAPENVAVEQVKRLSEAGFMVSLGHTDTTYETAKEYTSAGTRNVTHLFNAMSPLGHRQPGVVGAALDIGPLYAGIIADGIHAHPASMGVALRGKNGPGKIFIVTDAMSTIGTDLKSFTLNGREILRQNGRLTLADGTVAGGRCRHDRVGAVRASRARSVGRRSPADGLGLSGRGSMVGWSQGCADGRI